MYFSNAMVFQINKLIIVQTYLVICTFLTLKVIFGTEGDVKVLNYIQT